MKLIDIARKRFWAKELGEERFEDLSYILEMLTSLITGEFEGLGTYDLLIILDKGQILTQRQIQIGNSNLYQLLFYSIGVVIPLITDEMLLVFD